jgi:hypothetical protein
MSELSSPPITLAVLGTNVRSPSECGIPPRPTRTQASWCRYNFKQHPSFLSFGWLPIQVLTLLSYSKELLSRIKRRSDWDSNLGSADLAILHDENSLLQRLTYWYPFNHRSQAMLGVWDRLVLAWVTKWQVRRFLLEAVPASCELKRSIKESSV